MQSLSIRQKWLRCELLLLGLSLILQLSLYLVNLCLFRNLDRWQLLKIMQLVGGISATLVDRCDVFSRCGGLLRVRRTVRRLDEKQPLLHHIRFGNALRVEF